MTFFPQRLIQKLSYRTLLAALSLAAMPGLAQASALVINFDELYYDPNATSSFDQPLDDIYAANGVSFFEAFLSRDEGSTNNYAFSLGSFSIFFSGALPDSIAFNLFTESVDGLNIDAYAADGLTVERQFFAAGSATVSLNIPGGISSINFDSLSPRSPLSIDNLVINHASVPEPASLGLLGLGLLCLLGKRKRNG